MPMTQKEFQQKLTQSIETWSNIKLNDLTLTLRPDTYLDKYGNPCIDKDKNEAALKDWKNKFDTFAANLSDTVDLLLSYKILPLYCSNWKTHVSMSSNKPLKRGYEVSTKLRELAVWIYKCGQSLKTSCALGGDAFLMKCYLEWEDVFELVHLAEEEMDKYLNKYWKDLNNKGWSLTEADSRYDW